MVQAAGPRLTMTQKENALEEFAQDGWLAVVPGRPGTYSLGVSAHPGPSHACTVVQALRSLLEQHGLGYQYMLTRFEALRC